MSEKRYFKLFVGQQVKETSNIYLRLFNIYNEMKVYDKQVVLEKMGYTTQTNFPSIESRNNYLYQLLLKCLRSYHAGKTVKRKVGELLLDVDILYQKGLIEAAKKQLAKAEKMTKKYDLTFLNNDYFNRLSTKLLLIK